MRPDLADSATAASPRGGADLGVSDGNGGHRPLQCALMALGAVALLENLLEIVDDLRERRR